MKCPKCGGSTTVKDSRHRRSGNYTYRSRVCDKCGYRFYTHETIFDRGADKEYKIARNAIHALRLISAGDLLGERQ